MKNKIIRILLFVFIPLLFLNCSSELCLQTRTDRIIKKSYRNADTVYLYSVAFNNFNSIWYHKDDFIHSFWIKPHKTIRYKPIEAKNITVNDNIDKYFESPLYKNIQCFEGVLDGAWIQLYVKGKDSIMSSINMQCLFNIKFEINSFPYKLQYDFYKIGRCPKDYDFEKMYSETP